MNRHEVKLFRDLFRCFRRNYQPRVRFNLRAGGISIIFTGAFQMLLPDDKTCTATVQFLDAKGKAAKVDGIPVWDSDNSDAVTVAPAADGMSAVITPGPLLNPEPWTAQITVTADADLGEGMTPIIGTGSVTVTGGTAAVVELKFSEPA